MAGRKKKLTLWVLGTFLVFLLLPMILVPKLINLEPLKEEILASVAQEVGGQVEAQKLGLSFLIRPQVILHQVSMSIPGRATGTVDALSIYPKILPLFIGRVQPATVALHDSKFEIILPKRVAGDTKNGEPSPKVAIWEKSAALLARAESKAPGIVVLVTDGKLIFSAENQSIFRFQTIDARLDLSSQKLKLNLTCKSNLWNNLAFRGWLEPNHFKGNGLLEIAQFRPQALTDYLFPGETYHLAESLLNLTFTFESNGLRDLKAQLKGTAPKLTFYRGDEKLVVKAKALRSSFHLNEYETTVSLAELSLNHPELKLNGKLSWDRSSSRVSLELEGRQVDVDSTREAALAMAGDLEAAKDIFDVVRGGKVPQITFSGQGKSFADLGETDNFRIEGRITDGKIFIPGVNLDLEEVTGDAVISNGILQGRNASARLGNSRGREGTLTLGLEGENAPFHLEVLALADLADLPPILKRVVENEAFLKEISLVEKLEGRAEGRLVLGENTDSIQALLDVSECYLAARYRRIPFPMRISGGRFTYNETEVSLKNLRGELVASSFSDISGWFRWNETPYLDIHAGESRVSFDEIYSCLASSGIAEYIEKAQNVKGSLALSTLNLQGLLLKPEDWQVNMAGKVEHVTLNSNALGAPIELTGGSFRSVEDRTQQKLSLQDVMVTILDSSLTVSGAINDYLKELNRVDLSFQGEVGPEASRWLADFVHLPKDFHFRSPVSVSEARLDWEIEGKTSFSGRIDVQGGPRLSLDILQKPEELVIKRIQIEDKESRATLGFNLKDREFHLDFSGHLTGTTLGNLLQTNRFLKGKIEGDFRATFLSTNPERSTAAGSLSGKELVFEFSDDEPLKVESFSLEGLEKGIRVHSAVCNWGSTRMNVDGKVNFSKAGYVLDSALLLDRLEGDRLTKLFQQASSNTRKRKTGKFWDAPVSADLEVTAKEFSYLGLTWSALKAHLYLGSHKIHAVITRADLCGIATPGVVEITPQDFVLAFKPLTKNRDLASTLNCLIKRKGLACGTFNLEGVITADKKDDLIRSLEGNIEFVSHDGRLRRTSPSSALQQTFNLLDDTKAFEEKIPDLEKEGFSYKTITVRSTLKKGQLILKEATIDGTGMHIAFLGKVNLVDRKLDLDLLVSPFSTVDMVIGKVPLVSSILGGHLVTIPIKVQGNMESPKVTPLDPALVGKGLLRLLTRTLTLPVTIIQPLLPEHNQEKRQQEEKEKDRQNSPGDLGK